MLRQIQIIAALLILFHCPSFSQLEKVNIHSEWISENTLLVWGGDVYKDQIAAVRTNDGIILIDAGKSPSLSEKYRENIEKEFGQNEFNYLINTHYHFDHTGGNQVFQEATIIAHEKTPSLMSAWDKNRLDWVKRRREGMMLRWKSAFEGSEPGSNNWKYYNDILSTGEAMLSDYENSYELTLPDITFPEKMEFEVGGQEVRLYYYGEGQHTGDDILVFFPEEKILFSGDLFYHGSLGFAYRPGIDIEHWLKVLDELPLEEGGIEWIVDCHNGKMDASFLKLYHRYMKDVWESLGTAYKEGHDFSEVRKMYSLDEHFNYIRQSGISEDMLKKGHEDNLKFVWEKLGSVEVPAMDPVEVFNTVANGKYKGHYVNSPDTEHYEHLISWTSGPGDSQVTEFKEVPELDFSMKTIFFIEDNTCRFRRETNREDVIEGEFSRNKDQIILVQYDSHGDPLTKNIYDISAPSSIVDRFFRIRQDGSWGIGHEIVYDR